MQRRVLSLIPRATAEGTTVTVERHFTQLGQPAKDSWTGDVEGFAQRIAIALYGHNAEDELDDLQTGLRDQLGDALIAVGAVPGTMPIEILAQAGVLADAVMPITTRARDNAVRKALYEAADFVGNDDDCGCGGCDSCVGNKFAADLKRWAEQVGGNNEEKDTSDGSQPSGAASTARAEILAVLLAAGYNEPAALELVQRADREPRDPDPSPDFPETLAGGHALVVECGDCVMHASCQCGYPLGTTTLAASLDTFVPGWERHTAPDLRTGGQPEVS